MPSALLRLAAMPNCRPITAANRSSEVSIGLAANTAAVDMPI